MRLLARIEIVPQRRWRLCHAPGALYGSAYAAFLALGAYQDLGRTLPAAHGVLRSLDGLRAADGGYANHPGLPSGMTTATAAAVMVMRQLDRAAGARGRDVAAGSLSSARRFLRVDAARPCPICCRRPPRCTRCRRCACRSSGLRRAVPRFRRLAVDQPRRLLRHLGGRRRRLRVHLLRAAVAWAPQPRPRHDRSIGVDDVDAAERLLVRRLLDRRAAPDHWDGHLASSALSTATAILALHLVAAARASRRHGPRRLEPSVAAGVDWLIAHQNADGGWGDTVRSRSNISTTAIVWASLSAVVASRRASCRDRPRAARGCVARPEAPRLTRFAPPSSGATGRTGPSPCRSSRCSRSPESSVREPMPPGARFRSCRSSSRRCRTRWFQHLSLPVVSYALPALIAIGQVRHQFAPTRNPVARVAARAASVAERCACCARCSRRAAAISKPRR